MENEDSHPAVAKYMLVLMVCGLLFDLKFPLAVTADILHLLVWEAVRLLELTGLKVLCATADGASPNRKFFRIHKLDVTESNLVHKTCNPYSSEMALFLCGSTTFS